MARKLLEFDDRYAQKIADVCDVPYTAVLALREQGCLDLKAIRDRLIWHDYWALFNTHKFTNAQIFEKLEGVYNLGHGMVYKAVKTRDDHKCYCKSCGEQMGRQKYVLNGGLCDRCIANGVTL